MKKYLLLCTALTVASSAYALDCATPPTCAEWGFTMSTDDCAGKFVLRCPREPNNDNAVFCGGDTPATKCKAEGYTLNDGADCDKYYNKNACSYDSSYYNCTEMSDEQKCKADGYNLSVSGSCTLGEEEICPLSTIPQLYKCVISYDCLGGVVGSTCSCGGTHETITATHNCISVVGGGDSSSSGGDSSSSGGTSGGSSGGTSFSDDTIYGGSQNNPGDTGYTVCNHSKGDTCKCDGVTTHTSNGSHACD